MNASPRATHAQAALRETVSTMSARLVDEACITVSILGSGLNEDDIVQHPDIRPALLTTLSLLKAAIQSASLEQGSEVRVSGWATNDAQQRHQFGK